jgi:hypothetical protein
MTVGADAAIDDIDDLLRQRTGIERIRPLVHDRMQRLGQFRHLEHVADRQRRPVSLVVVGPEVGRGAEEILGAVEPPVEPWRHGEAVFGKSDRRFEQFGPGQPAVIPVDRLEQPDDARHADRTAADHGVHEMQRLPVRTQEQLRRIGGGGRFAAVIDDDLAGGMVVEGQEPAPAQARGLRLDQRQHQLRRDGRVGGAAARGQHGRTGLAGQRVRRHDHVAVGHDLGLLDPLRFPFGIGGGPSRRKRRRRRQRGQEKGDESKAIEGVLHAKPYPAEPKLKSRASAP